MSEWILATTLLFLMGLALGARPDGRASAAPSAPVAAPPTSERPASVAG